MKSFLTSSSTLFTSLPEMNSYSPDGIFNPHLTAIKDSHDISHVYVNLFSQHKSYNFIVVLLVWSQKTRKCHEEKFLYRKVLFFYYNGLLL